MLKLSWFWIVLIGIACCLLGYLIFNITNGKQVKTLKSSNGELTKENSALAKSLKNIEKSHDKLKRKHTDVTERLSNIEADMKEASTNHKMVLADKDASIDKLTSENKAHAADLNFAKSNLERSKKQYSALNEKYNTELKELKDWKKGKDAFDRELNLFKKKSETAEARAERYLSETGTLKQEITDLKSRSTSIRQLNTKIRVLEKDLKYWEKKHYDTHHELAEERKSKEDRVTDFEDLKSKNSALHDQIAKMETQVQEYKDQFVVVNDKYHKLAFNNK